MTLTRRHVACRRTIGAPHEWRAAPGA